MLMAWPDPLFFFLIYSLYLFQSLSGVDDTAYWTGRFVCAQRTLNWTSSFAFQFLWFCQAKSGTCLLFSSAPIFNCCLLCLTWISGSVGWLDVFHLHILHSCSLKSVRSAQTYKTAFIRWSRNHVCLHPCGSLEYSTKALGPFLVLYRKYFSYSKNVQELECSWQHLRMPNNERFS